MHPWFDGRKSATVVFALLPMLFVAKVAQAHAILGNAGGFVSGFEHPLTGLDHFLAMFAIGLWGAQIGGRSVWVLPVVFPLIMVVGGILGIAGVPSSTMLIGPIMGVGPIAGVEPIVEVGIALSVLALGLAIALSWKPSDWVVLPMVAFFALCHGHAHGVELPQAADPANYAIGFVVATGFIHVIGVGVGLMSKKVLNGKLTRTFGGLIALGGPYFLAFS